MLEELLLQKKIHREEYDSYMLFAMYEDGRNWFHKKMHECFLDLPNPLTMNVEVLAFAEGKRAMLREIQINIDKVNKVLTEENYVRSEPSN